MSSEKPKSFNHPAPGAIALLLSRRSGSAKAMGKPGPSAEQLQQILAAGARVPDHGKLFPWRFVIVPPEERAAFAGRLCEILALEKADCGPRDLEAAEQFALQAPALVVVLSSPVPDHKIPLWEQQLSAGAAAMNLLHAVHAMGFAGGWLTGWAAYSDRVRDLFGRAPERIAGFVFIGTPGRELEERPRPSLSEIAHMWNSEGGRDG